MLLTVATEDGNTFNLDLDGSMEVETLAALLEADVSQLLSLLPLQTLADL